MRVIVVGGGITGLSCALRLAGRGFSVEVFEKGDCLGGLSSTIRAGNAMVERYYHHFFRSDNIFIILFVMFPIFICHLPGC